MAEARIAVLYATREGQTERIADYIGDVARLRGLDVEVRNLDALPLSFSVEGLDGVLLGAPVRYGKHVREARAFVEAHLEELRAIPSGFFSVSMTAASPEADDRQQARHYVERFQEETSWRPLHVGLFPGALRYSAYNPLLKRIMRRFARRNDRSTDLSRDWEYTSWDAVGRFARAFLDRMGREAADRSYFDEGPTRYHA